MRYFSVFFSLFLVTSTAHATYWEDEECSEEPACDTWCDSYDMVYVCKVPPGDPFNSFTTCVPTDEAASHVDTGSFCGHCPAPACGDNICDANEDCATCQEDCGFCPACPEPEMPPACPLPPDASPPDAVPEDVLTTQGGGCSAVPGVGTTPLVALFMFAVAIALVNRKRVALLVLMLFPALAGAQVSGDPADLPVERFEMPMGDTSVLNVESAEIAGEWGLNLWLGYSNDPLVLYNVTQGEREASLLHHRLGGSLGAFYTVSPKLQLGINMPLTLGQDRDNLQDLDNFALGNFALRAKFLVYSGKVTLSAMGELETPTNTGVSYTGSDFFRYSQFLLITKRFGNLALHGNLGIRFQRSAKVGDLETGKEGSARVGAAYTIGKNELGATFSSATDASDLFSSKNNNYAELMVGYQRDCGEFKTFVGYGLGLNEGYGAPDGRVFLGLRYTPKASTRAPAVLEEAPMPLPEPYTPPKEEPTPEPEAPKPYYVVEDVFFEYDKAVLLPAYTHVLDTLAANLLTILSEQPATFIVVYGHTDSRGSDEYNLQLGKDRALAVMNYLISKGVPANHLEGHTKGESAPVAPNDTEENMAKNRRVEIYLEFSSPPPDIRRNPTTPKDTW